MAPCGCHAAKFDSCNSLLSSVHTLLVNILRCVRLYIKRKYYYNYIIILCSADCGDLWVRKFSPDSSSLANLGYEKRRTRTDDGGHHTPLPRVSVRVQNKDAYTSMVQIYMHKFFFIHWLELMRNFVIPKPMTLNCQQRMIKAFSHKSYKTNRVLIFINETSIRNILTVAEMPQYHVDLTENWIFKKPRCGRTSNMFAENKLNEYCHHQLRFSACSERDMMLVDYHLKYAELKNRLNEHFKPGEHVLHVKSSACLWCQLRLELVLFVLQGKRSNLYRYCVPQYHTPYITEVQNPFGPRAVAYYFLCNRRPNTKLWAELLRVKKLKKLKFSLFK